MRFEALALLAVMGVCVEGVRLSAAQRATVLDRAAAEPIIAEKLAASGKAAGASHAQSRMQALNQEVPVMSDIGARIGKAFGHSLLGGDVAAVGADAGGEEGAKAGARLASDFLARSGIAAKLQAEERTMMISVMRSFGTKIAEQAAEEYEAAASEDPYWSRVGPSVGRRVGQAYTDGELTQKKAERIGHGVGYWEGTHASRGFMRGFVPVAHEEMEAERKRQLGIAQ